MNLTINCRSYDVELQPEGVTVNGVLFKTSVLNDNGQATVRVAGRPYKLKFKDEKTVLVDGRPFSVEVSGRATIARRAPKAATANANRVEEGAVKALMPGTVLALRVKEGQQVAAGAVLLVLEAMKMQNDIKAPHAGTIKRVAVVAGQTVSCGDVMVVIEP